MKTTEPAAPAPTTDGQGSAAKTDSPLPRLLVIDSTRVGGQSATGQLKRNFLGRWRDDAFLQVCTSAGGRYTVARSLDDTTRDALLSTQDEVFNEVGAYPPEVIYYRPTIDQHPHLHALALNLLARHPVPLVTHIMDDWPSRLEAHDEVRGRSVDEDLRRLLSRSDKVLSISDKMSAVFGERYGVTFEAIANGVDPDRFVAASAAAKSEKSRRQEVVLRYCGALAKDMTFQTLVDIAQAVDRLQGELPVRLEVFTMPTWRRSFEEAVADLRGITISDAVFGAGFPSLLADADVLVLAYNFDVNSLRYVGLSMPNKLPEYLASGAALLAVGPREANGIDYVLSHDLGCCVTDGDPDKVAEALRRLGTDSAYRDELAERAQAWAIDHLDLADVSRRFESILREAAVGSAARIPLVGPFSRDNGARLDESVVVAQLVAPLERGGVLLDVGAHHGSSLKPFADADWTVVACEPDSENRASLVERFGDSANVQIDPRAVSDEPAQGMPLFSSSQSSGISSLEPFHETHREAETVDVTTVADLVDEHALPRIDFLKIDVEGLDWNVLKGVPWNRIEPEVIECEFEDAKTKGLGHTYRDIADYLVARGYTVYLSEWHPILRYGSAHDWRQLVRYPTRLLSGDAWGNILAFREDPGAHTVSTAVQACLTVEKPPVDRESAGAVGGSDELVGYDAQAPVPVGSSRYERLYSWATTRNPAVLFVGRLLMWCARKARGHPALVAAFLLVLAGLVAAGFVPTFSPYAGVFWAMAGALATVGALAAAMGFTRFLIKESRHELEMQQLSLRRRLERVEATADVSKQVSEQMPALEARIAALDVRLDDLTAEHGDLTEALEARVNALDVKLDELSSEQAAVAKPLAIKEIRVGGLGLRVLAANETDAPWYLQRKTFEEKESLLYPLIRAQGFRNFLDIGANYGFISMLARRAAPAMRVLSIEADPRVADLIEGNFVLNGLAPPEVVNAIAGSECRDSVPFSLNPSSSLDNRVSMPSWEQCSVPMRTIESILSDRGIDGSSFFKIDTQGYELHVLKGMEQLLQQRSDWLIKMEFAPNLLRSQGTDPLELLRYLADRYRIAEYPGRIPYNMPDLDSLFSDPVTVDELEPFLEYVISLDNDGLGWVDLVVGPHSMARR